jgi:phospholipid/cholesterol/gamma-HCH transport system substrate-binding protein
MSPRSREVRVGLVILAAILILAAGIFMIGSKRNLFSHKSRYFVEFGSVSGLKPGSPVQLDGVNVGAIEKVLLPEDPRKKTIRVWLRVESDFAARLRFPADPKALLPEQAPTRARIKTIGLLGDKYIDVNSGSAAYPPIPEEGEIRAAQPTNVEALIASGEDVMDNVVVITHSLNTILGRMERGEGILGQLTSDTPDGRRLQGSLVGAAESLQRIALKVETGPGLLPRLINDRALGDQLAQSLGRVQGLLDQAQHGQGLLPALLNDPASRDELNQTLAALHQVADDLKGFTGGLESSDALLPRLVKDQAYGREVTAQIRQLVERLNAVAGKLDQGNGTAGKLINDPKVYDSVNDIMIGVNQSKLLRWLIRNRQKKGIEKRYGDAKKAIEDAGGTPEPLDSQPEVPDPAPAARPDEPKAASPPAAVPPPADPAPAPPPPPPPTPERSPAR